MRLHLTWNIFFLEKYQFLFFTCLSAAGILLYFPDEVTIIIIQGLTYLIRLIHAHVFDALLFWGAQQLWNKFESLPFELTLMLSSYFIGPTPELNFFQNCCDIYDYNEWTLKK